jgi:hypothetical protein
MARREALNLEFVRFIKFNTSGRPDSALIVFDDGAEVMLGEEEAADLYRYLFNKGTARDLQ